MAGRLPQFTSITNPKGVTLVFNETRSVPFTKFGSNFLRLQSRGLLPKTATVYLKDGRIYVQFRRPPRTLTDQRTVSYKRWASKVSDWQTVVRRTIASVQAGHCTTQIVERVAA